MHRYLMCLCMLCFLCDCACCVFDATGNAAFDGIGSDVGGAGSVSGGGASFDVAVNACCYDAFAFARRGGEACCYAFCVLMGVVLGLATIHLLPLLCNIEIVQIIVMEQVIARVMVIVIAYAYSNRNTSCMCVVIVIVIVIEIC